MKNCKMAFTIGLVFAIMMLVAACTDSNKSDNHIFDHESLDVDEYVYPSDFDLGDDLKRTNSESDAGFETNVKNEEENKVYLEYPAQVYEDDTVIFEYYILEKASDGIDVYYSPSSFDEAEFLYHAVREN